MPTAIATPPHSVDAERTTLGALLLDPDAFHMVAGTLTADDFYDPAHRTLFAVMQRLFEAGQPIDYMTVSEAVKNDAKIQAIGGSAFLASLSTDVPTASHVATYARMVREHSIKRRAAKLGRFIEGVALDTKASADDVIDAAEHGVLELSQHLSEQTSVDLADLRSSRYDFYTAVYEAEDKAEFYGLTTGFPDLDRLLTGLPKGDLVVVAARPSMGKTAFVLDISQHVVNQLDKKVMLVSLEMSKEQVADRILAGAIGVSTHDLKKGLIEESDFDKMGVAFDQIRAGRFYIDDNCDCTMMHLRSKARMQQIRHGLDLLIVDYLQLLEIGGKLAPETRVQEVSKISRDLKRLARELKVPVIAVSQLSRSLENRMDKRPVLSDLRESGSIEQDADTVVMLHREDYFNEDTDRPGITDVYVRKQRQGPTGSIELRFDKERMRHRSVAHPGIEMARTGESHPKGQ